MINLTSCFVYFLWLVWNESLCQLVLCLARMQWLTREMAWGITVICRIAPERKAILTVDESNIVSRLVRLGHLDNQQREEPPPKVTKTLEARGGLQLDIGPCCTIFNCTILHHCTSKKYDMLWYAMTFYAHVFLFLNLSLPEHLQAELKMLNTDGIAWRMWATCACPAAKIWNTEILVHPPPQGHFQHSFPHCSLFISLVWVLAFNPSNGTVQATFFAWGSCSRRATATRCWHSSKNRFKVPKTSVTFPEVHPFPRKKNRKPIKSSNLFILCVSACLLMLQRPEVEWFSMCKTQCQSLRCNWDAQKQRIQCPQMSTNTSIKKLEIIYSHHISMYKYNKWHES